MEDDDEFGDLYSDVLGSFGSSSSALQQPTLPSTTNPASRPVDTNLQSEDDGILFRSFNTQITSSHQPNNQAVVFDPGKNKSDTEIDVSPKVDGKIEEQIATENYKLGGVSKNRVLDLEGEIGSIVLERENVNLDVDEKDSIKSNIGAVDAVDGDKDGEFGGEDGNFVIEGDDGGEVGHLDSSPIIPGLDTSPSVLGT
ncbi:hypothetical protein Nepgr_006307 [Nepenthes gracilis]|uniref:Uncharacterized protein n=1 Tax=Nepenthes gracilis TaxID=150966 RepID=A0AAD3XH93_NEPGR|nr:hypothetical protein Nepgr_006307 [Nepenthes gracilis]